MNVRQNASLGGLGKEATKILWLVYTDPSAKGFFLGQGEKTGKKGIHHWLPNFYCIGGEKRGREKRLLCRTQTQVRKRATKEINEQVGKKKKRVHRKFPRQDGDLSGERKRD